MPMMPTIPGSAGGAGMGSLKTENTNPTIAPVTSDKISSFMKNSSYTHLFLLGADYPYRLAKRRRG